ncbi:MAG: ROK family transcriptional regulator [Anaerolineales bacterium]|nr:ROK family transcriptional regulator [Anaerolineales bacterium]
MLQKATHEQTKIHNKNLVLKIIYDHHEVSRADIARITYLTPPTVSTTVAELIEEGLVEETGYGPSAGGKPPTLLRVVDDSRHLIGIDLANSEFRGAVINLRGQMIHQANVPVTPGNGQTALELVYQLIDRLMTAISRPLLGIGVGTPGLVDAQRGVVRKAVNLDWQDLSLRGLLETRYNLPVFVANDSHVAAVAEYVFGQERKTPNLIILKVGRGVSAGIVLNGRLHYGDGSGAGEIGHVRVVEQGALCSCGHYGCLETVTSSRFIVERAKAIAQENPHSLLHQFAPTPEAITTDVVIQAFEAGDEEVRQVIAEVGHYLGIAVANLIGTLNIQSILIGGRVARFGEPLLEPIRQEMKQRAMGMLADETQVSLSRLGQEIVILGAAALILTHELSLI